MGVDEKLHSQFTADWDVCGDKIPRHNIMNELEHDVPNALEHPQSLENS